jgi:hypothetical protein
MFANTFILALLVQSSFLGSTNSEPMHVVMRGGDVIVAPNTRIYENLDCKVSFRANGQLFINRYEFDLRHYSWTTNTNSFCNETMTWRLQRDGNLVAKCGNHVDYATQSHQGTTGDYIMTIDSHCNLHILKGNLDCNSVNLGGELWTNEVRGRPLKPSVRIGRGERWYNRGAYFEMTNRGDFEVWRAASRGTKDAVWRASAQMEWTFWPGNRDFYAKVTTHGHLQLVGVDLASRTEHVYFDKDLSPSGPVGSCFTIELDYGSSEYNEVDNTLIAVACN